MKTIHLNMPANCKHISSNKFAVTITIPREYPGKFDKEQLSRTNTRYINLEFLIPENTPFLQLFEIIHLHAKQAAKSTRLSILKYQQTILQAKIDKLA